MALPDEPNVLQAWWVKWEDYQIEDGWIRGVGTPYPVPLWPLLEPEERVPAFVAFANLKTEDDCLAFARRYSLLGVFSSRYPFSFFTVEKDETGRRRPSQHYLAGKWEMMERDEALTRYLKHYPGSVKPTPLAIAESSRRGIHKVINWDAERRKPRDEQSGVPISPSNFDLFEVEALDDWFREADRFQNALEGVVSEKPFLLAHWLSNELLGMRLAVRMTNDGLAFEWKPASLLTALWYQLAEHVTGMVSVRRCANCGRLFVPDEPRAKYCSYRCRIKRQNDKARGRLKTGKKEANQSAKGPKRPR